MKIAPHLLFIACIFGALQQSSSAALLSYWNFNNNNPAYNSGAGQLGSFRLTGTTFGEGYTQISGSASGTLASNTSNGTVFNGSAIKIDFANIDTVNSGTNTTINGKKWNGGGAQAATSDAAGFGTFSSSATNNVGGDVAGNSLILLNTTGGMLNKYITFSLSSAGYDTLSLSYSTRLTNAVTSNQVWSYSTDGTNYFSLSTISPTANATWINQSLNLSTLSSNALDNQSVFYLRMTYTGANSQGSQALDNIQLTGLAIPEPGTLMITLCGLGMLIGFQCRRSHAV